MKLENHLGNVTRRSFIGGTAGTIAASGAALALPWETDHVFSLEQTASALHGAIGRYADKNLPFFDHDCSSGGKTGLSYSMECLRDCSVEHIQELLKPLFEGGAK